MYRNDNDADSGESSSDSDDATQTNHDIEGANECTMLDVDEKLIVGSVVLQRNSARKKVQIEMDNDEWTVADSIVSSYITPEDLKASILGIISEADSIDIEDGTKFVMECGSVSLTLRRDGTNIRQQVYALTMPKVCCLIVLTCYRYSLWYLHV